jgi:hypothetical protein
MKNLNKMLTIGVVLLSSLNVLAQNAPDKKAKQAAMIAQRINGKDFLFNADYVTPERGGGHALNDEYDLTVNKDTITAYLPFFGRAYLAPPYGSTDLGIKFTWTKFTYEVTPDKKRGFDVLIKPAKQDLIDANGVQMLRLSVGVNGYATLQVINLNRDPITFQGTIESRRDKNGKPIAMNGR